MTGAGSLAPRYFEDIAVGERTRSATCQLTREMIFEFAKTYDPQPMHLDEAEAKKTFFGMLVASGWQTLAITMRLMVEARPLGGTPLVGIEIDEIRFKRPVKPGDSLTAELEIVGKQVSKTWPNRGFVRGRATTFNQQGAEVSSQLWTMLVPLRKPGL